MFGPLFRSEALFIRPFNLDLETTNSLALNVHVLEEIASPPPPSDLSDP